MERSAASPSPPKHASIPFQKDEPISVRFVMQGEGNFPEINVLEIPFPIPGRSALPESSHAGRRTIFEQNLRAQSGDPRSGKLRPARLPFHLFQSDDSEIRADCNSRRCSLSSPAASEREGRRSGARAPAAARAPVDGVPPHHAPTRISRFSGPAWEFRLLGFAYRAAGRNRCPQTAPKPDVT